VKPKKILHISSQTFLYLDQTKSNTSERQVKLTKYMKERAVVISDSIKESLFLSEYFTFFKYIVLFAFYVFSIEAIPRLKNKPDFDTQFGSIILPLLITFFLSYSSFKSYQFYSKHKERYKRRKDKTLLAKKKNELHLNFLALSFFIVLTVVIGNVVHIPIFVDLRAFAIYIHQNTPFFIFPYIENLALRFITMILFWGLYWLIVLYLLTFRRERKRLIKLDNLIFSKYFDLSFKDLISQNTIRIDDVIEQSIVLTSNEISIRIKRLLIRTRNLEVKNFTPNPGRINQYSQFEIKTVMLPKSAGSACYYFIISGFLENKRCNLFKRILYFLPNPTIYTKTNHLKILPFEPLLKINYQNESEVLINQKLSISFSLKNIGRGEAKNINIKLIENKDIKIFQEFKPILSLPPIDNFLTRDVIIEPLKFGEHLLIFKVFYFDSANNEMSSENDIIKIKFKSVNSFTTKKSLITNELRIPINNKKKLAVSSKINAISEINEIKKVNELWKQITNEHVSEIMKIDESEFFDRKQQLPKLNKVEEIIVAMSNTFGGILAFGFDDSKKSCLLNSKQRDGIQNQITSICTKNIRPTITPKFYPKIIKDDLGYIFVFIPRYEVKRHMTKEGRYLKRIGSNNVPIPPEEIIQLE